MEWFLRFVHRTKAQKHETRCISLNGKRKAMSGLRTLGGVNGLGFMPYSTNPPKSGPVRHEHEKAREVN